MTIQNPADFTEWYQVQQALCETVPYIIHLKELIAKEMEDDGDSDDAKELQEMLKKALNYYKELLLKSIKGHAPLRDLYIRNKTYAFTRMNLIGAQGNEKVYEHFRDLEDFEIEYKVLYQGLNQEQIDENVEAGNDLDISYYIEALTGVNCNKLINLANGTNLDTVKDDHEWNIRLKRLTALLEERKCYDELWLIKLAMIGTYGAECGVFYKGPEEIRNFMSKAAEILSEHYTKGYRKEKELQASS